MTIYRNISRLVEQRLGSLHDTIYQATNGRIGHHVPGAPPSLLLRTVGAKTQRRRTNSLTYARDGQDYLVVASNAGSQKAPGWYYNVKANPRLEIGVGTKRLPVTATITAHDDPDYPRLWQIVNENNSNRYATYQQRTSRRFPVIRLTP